MKDERKTVMVGRALELERLKSTFCEVAERQELSMVTVLGEAGIGKSRLWQEFQDWLQAVPRRASLFIGRAEAETGGLPFSLIRNVFRSRFEILESDSMSVACEKFARGFADLVGGEASKLQA